MMTMTRSSVSEEIFTWKVVASPLSIDAYNIKQFNSVILPFGLVSSFLHNSEGLPYYINKAAFSFIVGHEVSHSMDSRGRGFNLKGQLAMIWDKSTSGR